MISEMERKNVVCLPGAKRFDYFVKMVCDREKVWGLESDGWAMSRDMDGDLAVALWPDASYAELCRTNEWEAAECKTIELDELFPFLSELERDGVAVAIFPIAEEKSVHLKARELADAIKRELGEWYDESV